MLCHCVLPCSIMLFKVAHLKVYSLVTSITAGSNIISSIHSLSRVAASNIMLSVIICIPYMCLLFGANKNKAKICLRYHLKKLNKN